MRSILFCAATFLLFSCGKSDLNHQVDGRDLSHLPTEEAKVQIPDRANQVIRALQQQDFSELAEYIHPEKGLRFSPEVSVESHHRSFSPEEVARLWGNETPYFWGIYSGSGDSILAPFQSYYADFLYDTDFATTDSIYFNTDHQYGNARNNLRQAYPHCVVVEYYQPPAEEQYEGMDWRALRLVFEPHDSDWRLTGLVHAAWTP